MLSDTDQTLRGLLTLMIAECGRAPSTTELAARARLSALEVEAALSRLHDAHALLLHPGKTRPWVVHPFALSAGSCWVQTPEHGYWANCLYCSFGISAALKSDAIITTRIGGESETVRYEIENGALRPSRDVFHLATPVAQWWDNVIAACASFQPFHTEADIEAWCARHGFARGHSMSTSALWAFAKDWYGGYLEAPWRKRTLGQTRALFERHGLVSPFWSI